MSTDKPTAARDAAERVVHRIFDDVASCFEEPLNKALFDPATCKADADCVQIIQSAIDTSTATLRAELAKAQGDLHLAHCNIRALIAQLVAWREVKDAAEKDRPTKQMLAEVATQVLISTVEKDMKAGATIPLAEQLAKAQGEQQRWERLAEKAWKTVDESGAAMILGELAKAQAERDAARRREAANHESD